MVYSRPGLETRALTNLKRQEYNVWLPLYRKKRRHARKLEKVLRPLFPRYLFINFDPANMILYGTGEPIEALKNLGSFVRSIHCKDGTWAANPGQEWGAEVPLGEGDVGMETYLRTLDELGYIGPLTIEREIAQEPERQKEEIGAAVRLLTELKEKI